MPVSETWYRRAAAEFRAQLSEFGMTFPADQAERLIRERVQAVAADMRMSVPQAQSYLDPARLAEALAASFSEERPGEEVLDLPRDVTLSVPVAGRCVSGLAEAINVRLHYEPIGDAVEHVRNLSGPLSAVGLMMADVVDLDAGAGVPMPRALVLRIIRNLDVAAGLLDGVDAAPGELASEGRAGAERLANTFRGDANLLRALISLIEGPGPAAEPTAP